MNIDVVHLLENTAGYIDANGWVPGGYAGEKGEQCLINSTIIVFRKNRYASGLWQDAVRALADSISFPESCICGNSLAGWNSMESVVHWNDHHCDGGSQAAEICRLAAKKLSEESI